MRDLRLRAIFLVIAIIVTILAVNYKPLSKEPSVLIETTAIQFVKAVALNQIEDAKELSSGTVLYHLSTNLFPRKDIKIVSVEARLENNNVKQGTVHIKLEVNEQDNYDIYCYRLQLLELDTWKVYHVENADPILTLTGEDLPDIDEAHDVLVNYLKTLEKDYAAAAKYLTGRIKDVHLQTYDPLGKAQFDFSEKIRIEKISTGDGLLLSKAELCVSGQDVTVLVSFIRTQGGWKIYNVLQI